MAHPHRLARALEDGHGLRVGEVDVLRVVGIACERRDRFAGVDTRQQRRKQRVVMAEQHLLRLQQLDLTDEELRERALMGLAVDVGPPASAMRATSGRRSLRMPVQ